jgi:carbonic anhydrase
MRSSPSSSISPFFGAGGDLFARAHGSTILSDSHDAKFLQPDADDAANLGPLLAQNRRWVAGQRQLDPDYFTKLGAPQTPKYFYIGCADSRVPANEILGLPPGSVFTHRNVANLVVNTDMNLLACLQYAVDYLGVEHIIVCGHYDCGGVRASLGAADMGLIGHWIRNIRDVHRLHKDELTALSGDAKERRLVELNVLEQCLNLFKTGVVQRKRRDSAAAGEKATPRVHGLVFDPSEGVMHKLNLDFGPALAEYASVYNLYPPGQTEASN